MNLLDYIIIIVMIYLIVKGVLRGLIREVASLLGIILGIWSANLFQPHMSAFLRSYLPFDSYMPLLSFAVIFMVVLILCNLIGQDVENGLLPGDIEWLGKMVQDICYNNARAYFDMECSD